MADFYDRMFPEPVPFSEVVYEFLDKAYRMWAPWAFKDKLVEEFYISPEEAEDWIEYWYLRGDWH